MNGTEGTVVIGFDGSTESANAITRAGELLRPRRAVVVHCWVGLSRLLLRSDLDNMTGPILEAAEELDGADRDRAEQLAAEGASVARAAGLEAQPLVVPERENTWRTLAHVAVEHRANAVVVGARGQSAISSVLLGSVSNGLVHHPPAPILVVPGVAEKPGTGPLLFCEDGSDEARHALAVGLKLLDGASAVVASVYRKWSDRVSGRVPMVSSTAIGMARELDVAAKEKVDALVEDAARVVTAAGVEPDALALHSERPIWRVLLNIAEERDAAALVIGSRGLAGISAALGSVSHGVVQHSDRPVLVVPRPDIVMVQSKLP
jgi:nucleotide-binding universal stress UspA family protein